MSKEQTIEEQQFSNQSQTNNVVSSRPNNHVDPTSNALLRVSAPAFQPTTGRDNSRSIPSEPVPVDNAGRSQPQGGSPNPSPSTRSRSANYLLNFQSSQRNNAPSASSASWTNTPERSGRRVSQRRSAIARRAQHTYDRKNMTQNFVQANFRFLVSDAINVRQYELDPDLMLDWEDIAQVDYAATHPVVCPITLEHPVCPQITPCGHIFSFPAIMAHMRMHGGPELRRASPCPLCFKAVAARELRPLNIRQVNRPTVGSTLKCRLLYRPRDSIICEPVPSPSSAQGTEISLFAKFTTCSYPLAIWQAEGHSLAEYVTHVIAEGGLDAEYEVPNVMAAMDTLYNRVRAWVERRQRLILQQDELVANQETALLTPEEAAQNALEAVKNFTQGTLTNEGKKLHAKAIEEKRQAEFPALLGSSPPLTNTAATWQTGDNNNSDRPTANALPDSQPSKSTLPESSGYYFYQAADGQLFFLHPLNIKMLLHKYGAYSAFPETLVAKIIETETIIQSDVVRKRMKSLSHLPVTCGFTLCEVDLSKILDENEIANFASELAQRQQKRKQRAQKEAQQARRERANAAALAAKNAGPSAAELRAMPSLSASTGHVGETGGLNDNNTEEDADLFFSDVVLLGTSSEGPSFARIAALGFAATGPALGESVGSPDLGGLSLNQSRSPPGPPLLPAWGPRPSSGSSGANLAPSGSTGTSSTTGVGTQRKKSGKQVLLFSTSQRRY